MLAFVWLELTKKCNLECEHCYVESGPRLPLHESMTEADWLRVISESRELGCRSIQFIGGEPLLDPLLDKLILHARAMGFDNVEVFTNATALTRKRLEFFAAQRVQLATSFYTLRPPLHDQITGRRGSFHQTLAGILLAVEVGIPLRVEFIDLKKNSDDFPLVAQAMKAFGVTRVTRHRVQTVGRGQSGAKPRYSVGDLCGNCGKGRVCVTANGAVYPCIMARETQLGCVHDEALGAIVASNGLAAFRALLDIETLAPAAPQRTALALAGEACAPGGCGPDRDCGPDHKRLDSCGPDAGCGPDRGCGPDHKRTAGCGPDGCGPDAHSQPARDCGPDGCGPDAHPAPPENCGPDGCGPDAGTDRPCGPDRKSSSCAPGDECAPGGECSPTGDCAPYKDCAPHLECGPLNHASDCGPNGGCGPDRPRGPEIHRTTESCGPDGCGPDAHQAPKENCGPDGCGPDAHPAPDRSCGPDGGCPPDRPD